eukprot:719630_1
MYVNTYSHYAVYIISIKPTIVHLLLSPAHFARRINMKSEISIILFDHIYMLSLCPPSIYAIRCVSLFNHPSILRSPPSHLPINLTYHVMHAVLKVAIIHKL